jgi:hypothetical protein
MEMPVTKSSLRQKIVMDEIAGKNNAIQSYDKTLWTIRSGFLTLLFAAWGAVLSVVANNPYLLETVLVGMVCISFGLTFAGFLIDLNYVKRKFRCIHALAVLLDEAFRNIDTLDRMRKRKVWLRVSGDDVHLPPAKGYKNEVLVSCIIYPVPFISILVGAIITFLFL